MKKILSILGTITLIRTSTTNLVACNKMAYTEAQLTELKEKNNIKTNDGILEWWNTLKLGFVSISIDNKGTKLAFSIIDCG